MISDIVTDLPVAGITHHITSMGASKGEPANDLVPFHNHIFDGPRATWESAQEYLTKLFEALHGERVWGA